jgi:enamine deaminase RidA (YjgF/YER057c/UK114 family)
VKESGRVDIVEVAGWPAPRGYANGTIARGRALHVAGQIGWRPDGTWEHDDLVGQFGQALDNVLAVVRAAGGAAWNIASMTVFVTDIQAYRDGARALGPVWKARMERHFPAMALVGVAALVEPRAKVEIQAIAHLPEVP